MKVVILAGGRGTRLSEETDVRPKPMVEIGGRPILWHIMRWYSAFGFDEFVVCAGYKGYVIKEYFTHYKIHNSDVEVDLRTGEVTVIRDAAENWRVRIVDTGEETMTGGRLARVRSHVGGERFLFTYGDGLSDVDVKGLLDFHHSHGKYVTLTVVKPVGRFGAVRVGAAGEVRSFVEKPAGDGGWINGGYFVAEPDFFDYLGGDDSVLEQGPLERLVRDRQLAAFRHTGFWHPMDTVRDRDQLRALWDRGEAPWADLPLVANVAR